MLRSPLPRAKLCLPYLLGAVVASGTGVIDKLNRALFFVMLASLFVTMAFLAPNMTQDNLLQVTSHDHVDLIKTNCNPVYQFWLYGCDSNLGFLQPRATLDKQLRNMVIVGSYHTSVLPVLVVLR